MAQSLGDCRRNKLSHDGVISSVDADDPISPVQKPRGHGGVAILWHEKLSACIVKLPESTPRIVAIAFSPPNHREICMICAYLPCRGSAGGESEFEEVLDQFAEICSKYAATHDLIIAADFNSNILQPSAKNNKVKASLGLFDLSTFNCPTSNTFTHYNGMGSSQIDFIIGTPSLDMDIDILECDPINTSTNTSVQAYLALRASSQPVSNDEQTPLRPRPQWANGDPLAYREAVTSTLGTSELINPDCRSIDSATSSIIEALPKASDEAIPLPRIKSNRKRKTPWSEHIAENMRLSRKAHKYWHRMGRPDPPHEAHTLRRTASHEEGGGLEAITILQ